MTIPELPDDIWLKIYSHVYRAQFKEVIRQIDCIYDYWTTTDYDRKDEKIIADTFWEACHFLEVIG